MNENIRNIAVLGSTGSIGRQTLDVLSQYPERFRPWALVANRSVDLLVEQARRYRPEVVVIGSSECYDAVRNGVHDLPIKVLCGSKAIAEVAAAPQVDTVVTAMVGYAGLESTIAAIRAGKRIALANKETLVVAGELITRMLQQSSSVLYPVDSEHGAFYQCLVGERIEDVERLLLTASGGPFRTTPASELPHMRAADALRHPNWTMGAKITIDSATMMNKGFEMIEARWLFGIEPEHIQIVVHPQSIVHSMVQFCDGSVKAQLGLPDMRLPIRYALGLPQGRLPDNSVRRLSLADYATLTFEAPDFNKFPLLGVAYDAARRGGTVPCVMNAANEVAVAAFLRDEIAFTRIAEVVQQTIAQMDSINNPCYDDLVHANDEARRIAEALIKPA